MDSSDSNKDYLKMIKESIRTTEPAEWKNVGAVYTIGQGLVAKVFHYPSFSEIDAKNEFNNLTRLYCIDEDLRTPEPKVVIAVGTLEELAELGFPFPHSLGNEHEIIYATVMEEILGQPMTYLDMEERWRYKDSVLRLKEALIRNRIYKNDLKPSDIMAEYDSNEVVMIDVHNVEFDRHPGDMLDIMKGIFGKLPDESTVVVK